MKTTRTLLITAATLLSATWLTACNPSPNAPLVPWTSPDGSITLPDKPVYVSENESFCYVRLSPEQNARLRRDLAEAAVLQVELLPGLDSRRGVQTFTLSRGQDDALDETLDKLASVPQWLQQWMYTPCFISYAYQVKLRLYDKAGKLLWEKFPTFYHYQPEAGAQPVSLYSALQPHLPVEH